MSTWALVSMICGAVAIPSFQIILAVLAIVFGFIGLNEIKRPGQQFEGRGMAIAGITMGIVSACLVLLFFVLYIAYFIAIFSVLGAYPG